MCQHHTGAAEGREKAWASPAGFGDKEKWVTFGKWVICTREHLLRRSRRTPAFADLPCSEFWGGDHLFAESGETQLISPVPFQQPWHLGPLCWGRHVRRAGQQCDTKAIPSYKGSVLRRQKWMTPAVPRPRESRRNVSEQQWIPRTGNEKERDQFFLREGRQGWSGSLL